MLISRTSHPLRLVESRPSVRTRAPRGPAIVVRAQGVHTADTMSRRAVFSTVAGIASFLLGVTPSYAAYGDGANVFGKVTNKTGFIPYVGEGFALMLPSKFGPSKEEEFPGTVLRYEDNYFPVNNFAVMKMPSDKTKISDYGPPDKFLKDHSFLLGKQAFSGETQSEGGFAPNRVSAASILNLGTAIDKKGKEYYTLQVLTRTGDGNEGGKHNLIKATVADGMLWILKVQMGDKRWIRGQDKEALTVYDSFMVA